jgi:hypothetical protein
MSLVVLVLVVLVMGFGGIVLVSQWLRSARVQTPQPAPRGRATPPAPTARR